MFHEESKAMDLLFSNTVVWIDKICKNFCKSFENLYCFVNFARYFKR